MHHDHRDRLIGDTIAQGDLMNFSDYPFFIRSKDFSFNERVPKTI